MLFTEGPFMVRWSHHERRWHRYVSLIVPFTLLLSKGALPLTYYVATERRCHQLAFVSLRVPQNDICARAQ